MVTKICYFCNTDKLRPNSTDAFIKKLKFFGGFFMRR